MLTVNMREAKTHLSRLIERAAKGEPFVIAKAGKPMVKVVALDHPAAPRTRRVGFMAGQFSVPADFDRMGSEQVERLFGRGKRLMPRSPTASLPFFISEKAVAAA
jgi:prevent-host-death family protein